MRIFDWKAQKTHPPAYDKSYLSGGMFKFRLTLIFLEMYLKSLNND